MAHPPYREETGIDRSVLIAFTITIVAFKLVTSIMVLYFFPTWHALFFVLALSVLWLIGGAIYFGAVARVKFRLLKVRARRKRLLHEEWNVGLPETDPVDPRGRSRKWL